MGRMDSQSRAACLTIMGGPIHNVLKLPSHQTTMDGTNAPECLQTKMDGIKVPVDIPIKMDGKLPTKQTCKTEALRTEDGTNHQIKTTIIQITMHGIEAPTII